MKTFISILFLVINSTLYAQFNVAGTITSKGHKLEGVYINVLKSDKKTITNSNGLFKIQNINNGDVIRFSLMGYQTLDTLFSETKDIKNLKVNLEQSIVKLSEVELKTNKNVTNIIKEVSKNLIHNYPSEPTAFNALFRKQVVQNKKYLFLGNAQISILCSPYLSNKKKKVFLNHLNLTQNDLNYIKIKISPSSLLDFSPQFGFITSSEYFDFTFLESMKWNDEIYLKIAFKTKQEYWKDSPFDGVITIEKSSFAIAQIKWNTYKKEENHKGYNKKMGIFKGTFITNQLTHRITYTKKNDNLWYFKSSQIVWDLSVKYKKHPEENKNILLKSDLYTQKDILPLSTKNLKEIKINKDLFNKNKSKNYSKWEDLNPILPDFKEN